MLTIVRRVYFIPLEAPGIEHRSALVLMKSYHPRTEIEDLVKVAELPSIPEVLPLGIAFDQSHPSAALHLQRRNHFCCASNRLPCVMENCENPLLNPVGTAYSK